jgi:hypothetical protein
LRQLELPLIIRGTFEYSDVPTLKQLIQDKKNKPKGLENLSWDMINQLKYLYRGRI